MRADYGTENVKVAGIQRFHRRDGTDSFAGINSIKYVKSESNQRIEAWWGQLRKNFNRLVNQLFQRLER